MRKNVHILGVSLALTLTALLGLPGLRHSAAASPSHREPGQFQVAFVTRLQSVTFSPDSSVLVKTGRAESLQADVPGTFIGSYRERVLLDAPETDPENGLFKIRETLRTPFGNLTWEAVVLILDSGTPFYGSLSWSRGRIKRGTGFFAGASGTVEITGRNALCDPEAEEFCVPLEDDPTVGERQDFNVVLRGEIANRPPGGRGGGGRRGR
jgi:hypothetical protein